MKKGTEYKGFVFSKFWGDLIEAPSNPSLELLQEVELYLSSLGDHICASRIARLINVSYYFNNKVFKWCDSIYSINTRVVK